MKKKKKLRESEFENHSKVVQNWEQCGFRKVLGNRNKTVILPVKFRTYLVEFAVETTERCLFIWLRNGDAAEVGMLKRGHCWRLTSASISQYGLTQHSSCSYKIKQTSPISSIYKRKQTRLFLMSVLFSLTLLDLTIRAVDLTFSALILGL